jgi:hypothetical protein
MKKQSPYYEAGLISTKAKKNQSKSKSKPKSTQKDNGGRDQFRSPEVIEMVRIENGVFSSDSRRSSLYDSSDKKNTIPSSNTRKENDLEAPNEGSIIDLVIRDAPGGPIVVVLMMTFLTSIVIFIIWVTTIVNITSFKREVTLLTDSVIINPA